MPVTRIGRQFMKFSDGDGNRVIVRISAIQQASDCDEFQRETYVTVAGRTIPIQVPLDELEEILDDEAFPYRRHKGRGDVQRP